VLLKSGKGEGQEDHRGPDPVRPTRSTAEQIQAGAADRDVAGIPGVDPDIESTRKSPEVLPRCSWRSTYPVACLGWTVVG
jgi:hypothetical protein